MAMGRGSVQRCSTESSTISCVFSRFLNGHEWLARKLEANGVRFTKHDNAFLWIEDMVRAQKFSDRFANLNWPKILSKYAKLVTPQMQDILQDCSHYWVTAQKR